MGEEPARIEPIEESETSDSEQDEIPAGIEKLVLSALSQRIAEFAVGVRERMMLKKGGKGLYYRVGEIATLAIPKKYRVGIEVGRVIVRNPDTNQSCKLIYFLFSDWLVLIDS